MRFGRQTKADSLRSPKSPWGALRFVLLLAFVLLGTQWAAQGKNWGWLTGSPADSDPQSELTELDFEVKPQVKSAPGEARPTSPIERGDSADWSPRLPAEWLATMQDGSLGLTPSEQKGLDLAIQHVRSEATDAADCDVGFVMLNEHPEQHRGRLLEFRGTLWKLNLLSAASIDPLGEAIYEAWLYTPDAGNHPMRVLFTDLPPTLKPGKRLDQPVQFSGYFLKRYGYETAGGTHLAPLFVAKTLVPLSDAVPPSESRAVKSGRRWLIELFIAVAASAFLIWWLSRVPPPIIPRQRPINSPPVDKSTGAGVADPPDFDHNRPM